MPILSAHDRPIKSLRENNIGWLFELLRPSFPSILLGLLCVTLSSVAGAVDPLLVRVLIDRALPTRNLGWALRLSAGVGACFLTRYIFNSIGSLVNLSTSQQCARDLRTKILSQLNLLSEDFHNNTPVGDTILRFGFDVDEISTLAADTANMSVRAFLVLALNLLLMLKLSVVMTSIVVPVLPAFAILQSRFRRAMKNRADATRQELGSANVLVVEHVRAVPQVQILAAQKIVLGRALAAWNNVYSAQRKQKRTEAAFGISNGLIFFAAIVFVLGFGSYRTIHQMLSLGTLVAFYSYISRLFEPVSSAIELHTRTQSVSASILRIRELLALKPTVPDNGLLELQTQRLKVGFELKDVSVSYNSTKVFSGLTLQIAADEHIAVVGASGSGKSTLMKLLARILDPDAGRITLEREPLSRYRQDALRRIISYVPQHPILFRGTIRDNLLLAHPNANAKDIRRVLGV